MRYTGYFSIFGKRFKFNIEADSAEHAKQKLAQQILTQVKFDEPIPQHTDPAVEFLKDIFGFNKRKP
jgi:hypothetical protein